MWLAQAPAQHLRMLTANGRPRALGSGRPGHFPTMQEAARMGVRLPEAARAWAASE